MGAILFWSEWNDFRSDKLVFKMKVMHLESDTIRANVDLHILGTPCHCN